MTVAKFQSPAHFRDVVADRHIEEMKAKYDRGQEEHGGRIYEYGVLRLLRDGLDENKDQAWYLRGLEHGVAMVRHLLQQAQGAETVVEKDTLINAALDVLERE